MLAEGVKRQALRRSAQSEDTLITAVSQRGPLVAVFSQGVETSEYESHVFLFKLGKQQPIQHLLQLPAPYPDEGLCLHTWSPDNKKLALFWNGVLSPNRLSVACLSRRATVEREVGAQRGKHDILSGTHWLADMV